MRHGRQPTKPTLRPMLEIIIQIVGEFLLQAILEVLGEVGLRVVAEPFS